MEPSDWINKIKAAIPNDRVKLRKLRPEEIHVVLRVLFVIVNLLTADQFTSAKESYFIPGEFVLSCYTIVSLLVDYKQYGMTKQQRLAWSGTGVFEYCLVMSGVLWLTSAPSVTYFSLVLATLVQALVEGWMAYKMVADQEQVNRKKEDGNSTGLENLSPPRSEEALQKLRQQEAVLRKEKKVQKASLAREAVLLSGVDSTKIAVV